MFIIKYILKTLYVRNTSGGVDMNGLSLFSGGGIGETYLNEIGINITVANEIDSKRAEFYRHFYPETNMIKGDITLSGIYSKIIQEAKKTNVQFIIATPPCQGMSVYGAQKPDDEKNDLIKYAVEAVIDIKPKYALFENVPEQASTKIWYNNRRCLIPRYIERRLGNEYFINYKIIDTKDFGIPQQRKRLIFLLSRKDTKIKWDFPSTEPEITLREAFNGIPNLWPNIREKKYQNILPVNSAETLNFHKWHKPPTHVWRNVECMMFTPTGKSAIDSDKHRPVNSKGRYVSAYNSAYRRMSWDKPANTVTKSSGMMGSGTTVHPGKPFAKTKDGEVIFSNPRVLTIYELMIISSLPSDWNIPDWASDNLIRTVIGEGVPPLLIKKLIENI